MIQFLTIVDVSTSLSVNQPTVYNTFTLPGTNLFTLTITCEFLSAGTSEKSFIKSLLSSLEKIRYNSVDFLLRFVSHSIFVILNSPSNTFKTEK